MPGTYDTQGNEWTTVTPEPLPGEDTVDNFVPGEVQLTWYDPLADSLVDCSTFRDFTAASQTIPTDQHLVQELFNNTIQL